MQEPSSNELLVAAMKVLAEAIRPLSCDELIREMPVRATCPRGRTPEHLLYATLNRYVAQHGVSCPIHKTERGGFWLVQR